jgi:hypothetical protein
MGYDYFVAVPQSDANGTYCGCASSVDYTPLNLRMPIHSSHSRLLVETCNKSERYFATSNVCLAVESSCWRCVKFATRLTALETGELSGKQSPVACSRRTVASCSVLSCSLK